MANDLNVVVLVGRLTRDCEFKTTSNGTSVCRFSIAVNRRRKSGETWVDEVNYFDITYWRASEGIRPYLTKGRQVIIEGELRQDRWEQDGQTRSKVDIVAASVQLLSSSNGNAAGAPGMNQGSGGFNPSYRQNGGNAGRAPQTSSYGGSYGGYANSVNSAQNSQADYQDDYGNMGSGPENFEDGIGDDKDIPF